MGLDIVELVMRTEEVFSITIEDSDAEQVHTVGDLYELVCKLLNVSPTPNPAPFPTIDQPPPGKHDPLSIHTPEGIWIKLVVIIHDQLQVDVDVHEIRYNASFQNDLGAD
jgi:acyl carrier protein